MLSSSATAEQGTTSYVRVMDERVTWQNRQDHRAFVVNVRFNNATERPVFRHWCRAEIQRLIDTVWQTVQNTVCTLGQPPYLVIEPRDSAYRGVEVYSFPDAGHPYGDARLVAGTYRLIFEIATRKDSQELEVVPLSSRTTQPFVVRDP